MAYTIISQNNSTTTLSDGVNTITVPSRVNLTSGNFTIVEVNNNMATLEDGDGNVYRDIPCVATLAGESGGGGGSSLPDQTGHSGEFLTTDGTDASWSDKPLVNTATGTNSLTVNGNVTTENRAINIGDESYTAYGTVSIGYGTGKSFGATNNIGYSVFIGSSSKSKVGISDGRYAVAIGYSAGVDKYAIAIGVSANANQPYSLAIGSYSQALADYAIQLGGYSKSNSDANTLKVGNANGNFEMMSADGTIPEARLADTTNAQQGDVLTLDSTGNAVWQAGGSGGGLPSQTGNAGKFLTTDGTDASWSDKPLVNTATGAESITICGTPTSTTWALVIGNRASTNQSSAVSIGNKSSVTGLQSMAIGHNAHATARQTLAVGVGATASGTGAIQLGGVNITNSDANTFKVGNQNGNYEMMSADGTIPAARHASLPAADGTYTLQLVIADGVPTLSWVAE